MNILHSGSISYIGLKNYLKIVPLFFLFVACVNKKSNYSVPDVSRLKTINIIGDFENFVPNSLVFKTIYPIVLETNEKCLIQTTMKIVIKDRYIIIQNHFNNILVFDITGKFIRTIGSRGRGAGEYLSVLDFDVDDELIIHVCDGFKILKYTIDGLFLKSTEIDIRINNIPLAPEQIISNRDGGYYFWKTYQGIGPAERDQHSLIRIDHKHNIIEQNIPLKRGVVNKPNRFHKYKSYYNIDPPYGLDTIFAASDSGVFANYHIDFGKKTLPKPIPQWEYFSEYRLKMAQEEYVTNIMRFIETEGWIFFRFVYKRFYHNVYYSKNEDKIFVHKPGPLDPPHESLVMRIDGEWNGNVFSCIEPSYLHEKTALMEMPEWSVKLSKKDLEMKEIISKVPVNNNPILLICEPK